MSRNRIDTMAPAMTRVHDDSELVCEPHHDDAMAEDLPRFAVFALSDDPAAPRFVHDAGATIATSAWAIEPPTTW